jgi:hypothetical protein
MMREVYDSFYLQAICYQNDTVFNRQIPLTVDLLLFPAIFFDLPRHADNLLLKDASICRVFSSNCWQAALQQTDFFHMATYVHDNN